MSVAPPRERSRVWAVLDNAVVWNGVRLSLDAAFGLYRRRAALLRRWGVLSERASMLDVGCGIGQYAVLTDGEYLGIDLTARYVDYARRRSVGHPNRRFRVGDVETLRDDGRRFDVVLMVDFLHHLDRDACVRLLRVADSIAASCVISLEPVSEQDNPLGRWIIEHDRGDHMRSLSAYQQLFHSAEMRVERSEPLRLGPIMTRAVMAVSQRSAMATP